MLRRTAKQSKEFVSCPGSRFYQKRHGEVMPDGTIQLVEDEVVDIQEKMNAEYPSTTIENILRNSSPFDNFSDDGLHGLDCLKLPTNLAEFMQFQIDQKARFDSLSPEIRSRFGNDFNQFLIDAGSDAWCEKLGLTKVEEKPVEEVKTE